MTNPRSNDPTWLSNSFSTYLLLNPNTFIATVEAKITDLLVKYVGPELQQYIGVSIDEFLEQGNRYRFFLQKLTDIHLDPCIQQDFKERQ